MSRSRKSPLYGNCIIQAPDGQPLCRTSEAKIQWYVERDLGVIVSTNPTTLRLAFEPKGRDGADHLYTTAEKENICVVCGTDKEITRHHVVPKCFRKFFPLHRKEHAIHDVLILCIDCHNQYEEKAFELKRQIGDELGIPIHVTAAIDDTSYKVKTAAFALLRHYDTIPEPRRTELVDRLRAFLGKEEITKEDIEFIDDNRRCTSLQKPFGQLVVEQLEDIDHFILMWRSHFVETMKPQYLPIFWSVDNQLR